MKEKKAFQRFGPQKNQVSKDHIPSLLALKDNLWTKMYTFSFFSGMYAIFAFRNTSVCKKNPLKCVQNFVSFFVSKQSYIKSRLYSNYIVYNFPYM